MSRARSAVEFRSRYPLVAGSLVLTRGTTYAAEALGQPDRCLCVRPALLLVAAQRGVGEATGQHVGDLPAQVGRVPDTGVEALTGEGRHHVRGVAEQERAARAPAVRHQCVEPVDHRPLDLIGGDRPERGKQPLDERGIHSVLGRALPVAQQELVAAPAPAAGNDHVRAPRVAVVHAVPLVVRIAEDVRYQPRFAMAAPGHADAEHPPERGPATVTPEDVARSHGVGAALDRVPVAHLDAVLVLGQPDDVGVHADVDGRVRAEVCEQLTLQVRLGEGVLERVTEPEGLRRPGLEDRPPGSVVVAGTRPRDDHVQDPVDQSGRLVDPQRLVVEADRLRLVARGRVATSTSTTYHPRTSGIGRPSAVRPAPTTRPR